MSGQTNTEHLVQTTVVVGHSNSNTVILTSPLSDRHNDRLMAPGSGYAADPKGACLSQPSAHISKEQIVPCSVVQPQKKVKGLCIGNVISV
jgi:hypothetical protein